jgi:hypothetical protein
MEARAHLFNAAQQQKNNTPLNHQIKHARTHARISPIELQYILRKKKTSRFRQ